MANNLVVTTGAADQVPIELNTFQASAWNAIAEARTALDEMYTLRPVIPNAAAAPGVAVGNITFTPPGPVPVWDYAFNPPVWNVPAPALDEVTKNVVPDFTGTPPPQATPNIPIKPTPAPVPVPGDSPGISDITIPDAPVLDDLQDPNEWAITIPTAPVLNIPSFNAQRPVAGDISKPSADFNWQEDPYTSATLDCIVARINEFCAGGVGIPDPVWEMIWAKDNDRENRAGYKAIQEVNEEWSSRGFALPQGIQIAQVQEIQQGLQNTSSQRSREVAIRESDLAIENLKFAVVQGIALENLRGSWYQATMQRMLEATRFASELAISVFNADIAFYNAQVQMYLADVQVYKVQLEAEITRLEVYKTELEGQKIIGELNMQQVQIYKIRVEALNLEIDRYNAILAGIKTTVDVDVARIEAYRAEVQAFGERIKAVAVEYQGYATEMDGAKTEAQIYGINVDAYASTVQAYSSKVDAEAKNSGIDIAINKYKLEEYNINIQAFIAELEAKIKELQAESTAYDAEIKGYISGIDAEKASIQAQTAKYTGDIQIASQTTQANIANAQANAQNAIAEAQIVQKGLESIANVNGAYAGSALSAANISMSMSDSAGNSASA